MSEVNSSYNTYMSELQSLMMMDSSGKHVQDRRRMPRKLTLTGASDPRNAANTNTDPSSQTEATKRYLEEHYKQVKSGSFRSYAAVFAKNPAPEPRTAVSTPTGPAQNAPEPSSQPQPRGPTLLDAPAPAKGHQRTRSNSMTQAMDATLTPVGNKGDAPQRTRSDLALSQTALPDSEASLPSDSDSLSVIEHTQDSESPHFNDSPLIRPKTLASAPMNDAERSPEKSAREPLVELDSEIIDRVSSLGRDLTSLESRLSAVEGRMVNKGMILSEISTARNQITMIEQAAFETKQRVGVLEREVSTLQHQLGSVRTEFTTMADRLTALEGRGGLSERVWRLADLALRTLIQLATAVHGRVKADWKTKLVVVVAVLFGLLGLLVGVKARYEVVFSVSIRGETVLSV
ncbi:chromosome segregation protein [Carpediemonas membranifera]|uniref:Chromosome segregation protein n=1 Tax=Carpediemonas membranifera TaxID=201153 RepID=A0A8J6E9Q9_9EUKA|nr:chromosome segregation protein [Carpediemonas membranifera]|eukprot:KAG9393685.1 chromosome segregation protein [Carpediemonas membranifera]